MGAPNNSIPGSAIPGLSIPGFLGAVLGGLERLVNDATTTLFVALTSNATRIYPTDGSKWPTDGQFRVRVQDRSNLNAPGTAEIILVAGGPGPRYDIITRAVERAGDSQTTVNHPSGADTRLILTSGALAQWLSGYRFITSADVPDSVGISGVQAASIGVDGDLRASLAADVNGEQIVFPLGRLGALALYDTTYNSETQEVRLLFKAPDGAPQSILLGALDGSQSGTDVGIVSASLYSFLRDVLARDSGVLPRRGPRRGQLTIPLMLYGAGDQIVQAFGVTAECSLQALFINASAYVFNADWSEAIKLSWDKTQGDLANSISLSGVAPTITAVAGTDLSVDSVGSLNIITTAAGGQFSVMFMYECGLFVD